MAGPVLYVLAGPNGAGKTSLYEAVVRQMTNAEFVNADRLSFEALGRHALTREDAQLGQRLADERREALFASRQSLVTESTFSHPSKLQLIQRAKALGYRVVVFHVNVSSAEHAIVRVAMREAQGGHPVPEANIRGRYDRNPPLIREAVRLADSAYVFDNSALGRRPRHLMTFAAGRPRIVVRDLPEWAATLYGPDIDAAR